MTRIARVLMVLLLLFAGYHGAFSKDVILYDEDDDTYYEYDNGIENTYFNVFLGLAQNMEDSWDGGICTGLSVLYTTAPNTAFGLIFAFYDPSQHIQEDGYNYGYEIWRDIIILQAGGIGRLYLAKIPDTKLNPFLHFGASLNLYKKYYEYESYGSIGHRDDSGTEKDWTGNIGLEAGAGLLLFEHLEFSAIYRTSSAANFVSICIGFMF